MRHWFSESAFRSVLRNASYLGSTKLVGALLGLVALAAAGRSLTTTVFGLLMVVHTYALGANAIVKFQSWQLIVRYGAPALQSGDRSTVRDSIRFAFGLDIASGIVGMVAAMALLPFLAGYFRIGGDIFWLALFYCTLVPTMSAATPTGVLRLYDRFDLLAVQQLATPALRATGAVICWIGDAGFVGFVITWYFADLIGDLILWALTARELRRHDMTDALRPGFRETARRLPGVWNFVWTTNFAHTLSGAWGPVSNLVVASIMGPIGAGLYKVASTFVDSASKPADLLTRGFYPEIMRLDPASATPWRLGIRIGLLAGGVGIVAIALILIGGKPLIGLVFGPRYLDAFPLLSVMMMALAISTASFPLESLLYMVGRQRAALIAQIVATVLYLGLLYTLTVSMGLYGAGLAYLVGSAATALFMLIPVIGSYRRRSSLTTQAR